MAANGSLHDAERLDLQIHKQHSICMVLDYGSQYTQLIARRVRENNVCSLLLPGDATLVRHSIILIGSICCDCCYSLCRMLWTDVRGSALNMLEGEAEGSQPASLAGKNKERAPTGDSPVRRPQLCAHSQCTPAAVRIF